MFQKHRLIWSFLKWKKHLLTVFMCLICCSNSKRADTKLQIQNRTTSCVFEHSISTTRTNMYIAISLFQNMTFPKWRLWLRLLCFNYCFHQKLIINFHHYSLPKSHSTTLIPSFPILYIHPHKTFTNISISYS